MENRRITFRLYPNRTSLPKLHYARKLHWALYNAGIANRRTQYEKFGKSVSYYEQQNSLPGFKETWIEYKQLGSHTLQNTLKRVDLAYQSFFKGLRGKPRFRPLRKYSGWTYPDHAGWKIHSTGDNGYLELRDLGLKIQMRGKARTWGKATTCTLFYRNSKWYASITIGCNPIRETGAGCIGLDFGCSTAVALSDGTKIENPRFLSKTRAKIRKASKLMRRKQAPNRKKKIRGSQRWKKANKKVAKLHTLVSNQRKDWAHQVATQIVSGNSLVATEKLNIKAMTRKPRTGSHRKRQKTGLNRSILDVGWGFLGQALVYKLAECEGFLVEIPTLQVKPSQTCPECGHQERKTLDTRVHNCTKCGYIEDRDVASAKVCLSWALGTSVLNRGSRTSISTPQATGGWQQVWEMKRQKLTPSDSLG
jgi:putative transposase